MNLVGGSILWFSILYDLIDDFKCSKIVGIGSSTTNQKSCDNLMSWRSTVLNSGIVEFASASSAKRAIQDMWKPQKPVGLHRKPFLNQRQRLISLCFGVPNRIKQKVRSSSNISHPYTPNVSIYTIDFCYLLGVPFFAVPRTDSILKGRPIFVREQLSSYRFHHTARGECQWESFACFHAMMPCYSVAIKPGLLRSPLNFSWSNQRETSGNSHPVIASID